MNRDPRRPRAIAFTIPLAPVAWQRVRRGRHGQSYVPDETAIFKGACAVYAVNFRPRPAFDGALRLTAKFFIARPKRPTCSRPKTRPDLDNYMKALKDALNLVIWSDDARVCEYGPGTGKYYAEPPSRPRIEVIIEEIEGT